MLSTFIIQSFLTSCKGRPSRKTWVSFLEKYLLQDAIRNHCYRWKEGENRQIAHQEFKFPANARICEDELRKGSIRWLADCCSRCVPDAHGGSFKNYRRPRPILPAPLKESEGKKWKLPTGIVSSAEPPKPSKQEVLLESGLRNYITHCLRQI